MRKFLLFISICMIGCVRTDDSINSKTQEFLNGLYEMEVLNSGYKQIWIFAENTHYIMLKSSGRYANDKLGLTYEAPTKYYIEDNLIYQCGLDKDGSPISLKDCFNKDMTPYYKIIKVDTLYDGYNSRQNVIIQIINTGEKYRLQKVFYDNIERAINVNLDIFDAIDKSKNSN